MPLRVSLSSFSLKQPEAGRNQPPKSGLRCGPRRIFSPAFGTGGPTRILRPPEHLRLYIKEQRSATLSHMRSLSAASAAHGKVMVRNGFGQSDSAAESPEGPLALEKGRSSLRQGLFRLLRAG